MAISSITLDSVAQVLGQRRIRIDYTINGSDPATDLANVYLFYLYSGSVFNKVRVFQISGDFHNQGNGSHTMYWERPDIEYGAVESSLSVMLQGVEI